MDDQASDVRTGGIRIELPGTSLLGRLFQPSKPPASAIVLHGATGVPQQFYRHFAAWIADRFDAAVLTYDYRDFGRSAMGHVRSSTATMVDWGVHDQSAALDWLVDRHPGLPIDVIGHSLGGQMLPFHRKGMRVRRLLTVGSGLPHWMGHPVHYMAQVVSFWFLHGPALVATLGYLPGRAAGLGADLPAGVYWQWRRWCVSRGYYARDVGGLLPEPLPIGAQVALMALSDDVMVPPRQVTALKASYPASAVTVDVIAPNDAGLGSIGHIGPFASRNAAVWPLLVRRWDGAR